MRRAPDDDRNGRGHLTSEGAVGPAEHDDDATAEGVDDGSRSVGPPSPSNPGAPARRTARAVAIALVGIAVVVAVGFALRPSADPRVEGGVAELDEPLPRLRGEAVTGGRVDTDSFAGRVLVVNVWATWCDPCRREQPALQRVQRAYEGDGVEFLGVNYRDDRALATRWIEDEFEVGYPSLYDPDGRTAAQLGFPFLPDTYVVGPDGVMRFVVYGETSQRELSGLIDRVLAEPEG